MSIFTKVAMKKPRYNTFDLSHDRKFSMFLGRITPCFIAETVPGDNFRIDTSQLVRFTPMVAPVMHRFSLYTHFFYVPTRILWKGFEKFINGGYEGEDAPVFPFIELEGNPIGALGDYLGLPNWDERTTTISAIPYAAYLKIWYEYYRDQNLTAPIEWLEPDGDGLSDGDNSDKLTELDVLRKRAWQHDYFTSALPWTQRGPQATIPLGASADIGIVNPANPTLAPFTNASPSRVKMVDNATFTTTQLEKSGSTLVGLDNLGDVESTGTAGSTLTQLDVSPHTQVLTDNLFADLETATAATINDLRRAFRLQEWLELNARAGARYNETIMAHFGVSVGDARLQRPEFLGGSATPIVISEVLQTSGTDAEPTPQGNMAGHGVSIGGKNVVNYYCREHGYIIGVCSIMPKSAYQQGIPKHWFKFDKFDYFWKSFANIGEQAILNKELFYSSDGLDDEVFGYVPRYAEYKYIPDTVHGEFRGTLDFWHAGRIFSSRPTLSQEFIEMDTSEVDRIFAVVDANERAYVQMHHRVKARRPMPYFGTPTI